MKRKLVIVKGYKTLSYSPYKCYLFYCDLNDYIDNKDYFGFDMFSTQKVVVPYSRFELFNYFGSKLFYSKTELVFDDNNNLLSIKNGNSFLCVKHRARKYSILSQKEINKLMKDNFG